MNTSLSGRTLRNLGALACMVVATSALAVGTTSALFSASAASGASTFATGTVTVGPGGTSTTCAVANMMPGDSSTNYGSGSASLAPCDYRVKYTGSSPAWLAADITVTAGSTALYTATSTGLQMKVAVTGGPTLMNGTTVMSAAGSTVPVVSGTATGNILLSTTPAATNDTVRFDIDYLLPLLAPNTLQGGTVSVTITFRAAQAANQPLGTCLAGRLCSDISWG